MTYSVYFDKQFKYQADTYTEALKWAENYNSGDVSGIDIIENAKIEFHENL